MTDWKTREVARWRHWYEYRSVSMEGWIIPPDLQVGKILESFGDVKEAKDFINTQLHHEKGWTNPDDYWSKVLEHLNNCEINAIILE